MQATPAWRPLHPQQHLITHGIPSRYPRMKILNSHLGGALPMLLQRMDNQLP